jgi:uncharacterized protein YjiS (DUF1127 family)
MSPHTQNSRQSEKDRAMERTLSPSAAQPTLPQKKTNWALRLVAVIVVWRRNARTRKQLARLDDRQLADAGICPCEREMELEKPFWRE